MPRFSRCLAFALLFVGSCSGQKYSIPTESAIPAATIHSRSELVLIDVVVTDERGKPIPDLSASDFTVLEDAESRPISSFMAHESDVRELLSPKPRAVPVIKPFPSSAASNLDDSHRGLDLAILLVDLLNTEVPDQQFARQQLIEIVRQVPENRAVMMLVLAKNLIMTVSPTTDRQLLADAAQQLRAMKIPLLLSEVDKQKWEGAWKFLNMQGGLSGSGKNSSEEAFYASTRASNTFQALRRIGETTKSFPGRKSLVWLTGAIPVDLGIPLESQTKGASVSSRYATTWAELSRMFEAARIAVYPIDVRGLRPRGINISVGTAESTGLLGGDPAAGNLLQRQTLMAMTEQGTMKRLADETGGRSFLTNDVSGAILDCVNDGTYYALAVKPKNTNPDGSYHKIEVQVSRPEALLHYRRGYFHADAQPKRHEQNLLTALAADTPDVADLFMSVALQKPNAKHSDLRLSYVVDPQGVTFSDRDGAKHAELKFLAIAFDEYGRVAMSTAGVMEARIPLNDFSRVTADGMPANQQMELKPGRYLIRVGVMDAASGSMGTVTVPNVVIKKQSARERKSFTQQN